MQNDSKKENKATRFIQKHSGKIAIVGFGAVCLAAGVGIGYLCYKNPRINPNWKRRIDLLAEKEPEIRDIVDVTRIMSRASRCTYTYDPPAHDACTVTQWFGPDCVSVMEGVEPDDRVVGAVFAISKAET